MSVDVATPAGKGIKGRRVEGRPGRFDPSTPLHMTTRRAARSGYPNTTPSINGSLEDEESPHGSVSEELTRTTLPNEQPSQRSRESQQPTEVTTATVHPSSPQSLNDPLETPTRRRSLVTAKEAVDLSTESTAAATRKRKRAPSLDLLMSDEHKASKVCSSHLDNDLPDRSLAIDAPAPASQSVNREEAEEHDAGDASPSEDIRTEDESEQDRNHTSTAIEGPSIDATPAVSAGGSPASSISSSAEVVKSRAAKANATFASQENEIGADADDDDEIDEAEDGAPANASQPKRKFGGKRRRAIHQNIRVELTLRRQLELKKAYRSIARELKGVLNELADRTLYELDEDEDSYTKATEYKAVKAGLDAALEARRQLISRQRDFQLGLLLEKRRREEEVRESECKILVEKTRDTVIQRLHHDVLVLAREFQLKCADSMVDTEDEDDVVPRPKHMKYHFKRTGPVDNACDSRSRLAIEVERSVDDLHLRLRMGDMLRKLSESERPVSEPAFAVMDNAPREAADARQQEVEGTRTLASAAEEVERMSSLTIPNEQAVGLQILGDVCSQPVVGTEIHQTVPPPPLMHHDSPLPTTPTRPIPTPAMPRQSITVELSPRTSQIFRDRFEYSMPPPLTPRMVEATFGSPFAFPTREPLPPPASPYTDRSSGLPPLAAKPGDVSQHPRVEGPPLPLQHGRPERLYEPMFGRPLGPLQSPRSLLPQEQKQAPPNPNHLDRRSKSLDDFYPFDPNFKQTELASRFGPPHQQVTTDRDRFQERDDRPRFTVFDGTPTEDRSIGSKQQPLQHLRAAVPSAPSHRFVFDNEELHHPRPPSGTIKDEPRSEAVGVDHAMGHKPERSIKFKHDTHGFGKPRKPNKAERGGASRREKKREKLKHQTSRTTTASSVSSPTTIQPPTLHAPTDGPVARPAQWPMPTLLPHTRATQMPPVTPSSAAPLTQPGLGHIQPAHDFDPQHHHRHSLPSHQSPIWHPPVPSPLYAVPQPLPHPPPAGTDQFRGHPHYPGPPVPPGLFHPRPPLPPHILPSASEYQQHGGQMLAPAIPDPRFHLPGFRPAIYNHPPAFAQQQKSHSESSSSRKRAQSDGNSRTSNWRAYEGPGKR